MVEGSSAALRVPGVVAVVVADRPGPWFAEVLEALDAQDYGNLSLLVLAAPGEGADAGGGVPATVAAHAPDAFVHRLDANRGFGAAVDEALAMVEGAAFFLLCHDDCAPAPDATRLMVEESFRSNAGVVCPKLVRWEDERALLHVGQSADKTGKPVERVQDGEIDAGQHDSVRDVFVAPGGLTLVRADLFRALGGYDPAITAMGEDLDLSWRAHVAGARVVVAPAAVARHLEVVAGGRRQPPLDDAPSLQALQRRNELRAVLTCYSLAHLVRVVPQALVLSAGEFAVSLLFGDSRRAAAVVHAWRWNLSHLGPLRHRRGQLRRIRAMSDRDVRSLQVRGSARLSTYLSRLVHHGVDAANGVRRATAAVTHAAGGEPAAEGAAGRGAGRPADSARGGGIGLAFSEDADFDELDDLGRAGHRARGRRERRVLASRRARFVGWLVAAAVLVVGSRQLFGSPLPVLGQYLPFPSWTGAWHQLFTSWQSAGLGARGPGDPAFGLLGLLGTVLFGRMGLLQEVLVLGCVPAGGWGMARLLGPFGSPRARFAGTVAYLFLPLAYDALSRGRWDGLVAFAATPWVLGHLARASGAPPFDDATATPRRWRRTLAGRALALGALEAGCVALAPSVAVVVLLSAAGLVVGSLPFAGRRGALRAGAVAVGATVVAAALLAPWAAATVAAGHDALAVLGLPASAAGAPGWSGLLRLAVGPGGGSALRWALLGAAVVPLLLASGPRLAWTARLGGVALGGWLLALVSVKGWAVPFAPSVDVMLAPAAAGLAACLGIAVAAFERDLAGHRFGWRQLTAVAAVAGLVVGLLPTVADAQDGRWGTPQTGYAQAAGLTPPRPPADGYRVLWLGDPRGLPLGGWAIGPGLAYATSADGTPTLADLWPPAAPGGTAALARDVRTAMSGGTVRLGRLLAAAHVRYVVVVRALAPHVPGGEAAPTYPPPAGLVAALARQEDLRTVPESVGALAVFENAALTGGPADVLAPARGAGVAGPLEAALMLLAWVLAAGALLGRRRWLDWWWGPLRGRRRPRLADAALALATGDGPPDGAVRGNADPDGAGPHPSTPEVAVVGPPGGGRG
jgi:GT2 family glycosyltransferase